MAKMFSHNGDPLEIPEDQVIPAFLSGQAGFPSGFKVPVLNPDGKPGVLPVENLRTALQSGYRYEPLQEREQRRLQKTYGEGFGQALKATGEAVARGLIPGGDLTLKAAGVSEEAIRERKRGHPVLATGGEIIGTIAPILATGGAAIPELLAQGGAKKLAIATPGYLISRAGTRVEKALASKILTKASESGAVTAAIPKIAGATTEGALYGIKQLYDESQLGDAEFTAENLISHAGMGALLGGGTIAGLDIGKVGAQKALSMIKPISAPVLKSISKRLSSEGLMDFAYKKAAKSLGPYKAQIVEARKYPHGFEGVGKDILESRAFGVARSPEDMLDDFVSLTDETGKKLDDIINQVDDAVERDPSVKKLIWSDVYEKIKSDTIDPLSKSDWPELRTFGERLEDQLSILNQQFPKGSPIPIRKLVDDRRELDRFIYRGGGPKMDTYKSYLSDVRKVIEKAETDYLQPISDKIGLGESYKGTKRLNQSYRWAKETIQKRIDGNDANRSFSLTDYGMALTAGFAKAVIDQEINMNALAAGLVAGGLNKIMRSRGNTLLAAGFGKAAKLSQMDRVNQAIHKNIDKAIESYFTKQGFEKSATPISVSLFHKANLMDKRAEDTLDPATSFDRINQQLTKLKSNPEEFQHKMSESIYSISHDAPNIGGQINMKQAIAIEFLNEKMPKNPDILPIGKEEPYKPSDSEMSKFSRYYSYVDKPQNIIRDFESGQLTQEGVETLQRIYPKTYEYVKEQIVNYVAEGDVAIPYQKKLQMSLLLGVPLTQLMKPEFLQSIQQGFQRNNEKDRAMGNAKFSRSAMGSVEIGDRKQTESQRISTVGVGS